MMVWAGPSMPLGFYTSRHLDQKELTGHCWPNALVIQWFGGRGPEVCNLL